MTEITWHRNGLPDEAQQWRRQIEETVSRLIRDGQLSSSDATAAAKERASLASAIARSGLTLAEQTQAVVDARRAPAAPENPQVTTDAYFDEYGVPRAAVSASCDVVNVDTLGKDIEVQFYELYGRHDVAGDVWQKLSEDRDMTTAPNMTYAGLPAGEDWAFKMRAVAGNGVQGEFSGQVTVTLAKDTTPPPQPAPLAGSTRLGQTSLFWSGLTAGGQAQPPDFSHAEVWISSTSTGAGSAIGRMGVNDTFYPEMQPYNETRWYWLVAVDVAGNRSMASTRTDVTTKPLVDTDVIGQVISGANIVNGSVNAADKIIGNTITGGLIQALAIDSGKLAANAVTADKIDAGAVTAEKVAARSMTADKLVIGNSTNLIPDPAFMGPVANTWWARAGGMAGWTVGGATALPGRGLYVDVTGVQRSLQCLNRVPVVPGEQYFVGARGGAFSGWTGSMPGLLVLFYDALGAIVTWNTYIYSGGPDGFRDIAVNFAVPADQTIVEMAYELFVPANATAGRAWFAYPTLRQATTGSLIVDGAIDGKTITGALIRTAASGARTEMTTSGLRTLNSAGQELVRIGYGIPTGMSVRNPGTGALVPLSDAAFGATSIARTDVLAFSAPASETPVSSGGPGTRNAWTRHSGDTLSITFTAVAPRYLIQFGQNWATNYVASMGASLEVRVAPTVNGARVTAANGDFSATTGQIQSASTNAANRVGSANGGVPITTTPGASYTIQLQFATIGYASSAISSSLADRYITATPVFN